MILYVDSSSAIKLYLRRVNVIEEGADTIYRIAEEADVVATSRITYVEVMSGLAIAYYNTHRIVGEDDYRGLIEDFTQDWRSYVKVSVTNRVVRLAGDLADRYILRGYDSVQLASALDLEQRLGIKIIFSTWDNDLLRAAPAEGLIIASNGGSS
ncbi:MAG: hypothetical protein HW403_691 [Dehalococcoidia bacterium]|nr:hypothetical protein [Dehalococcoidia bacterium]